MKRFAFLFIYISLIIVFMVTLNHLVRDFMFSSDYIGKIDAMTTELLHAGYPMIAGVLLAIPYLIKTLKQPGQVYYDLHRALALGIPTFIVATSVIIYYLSSLSIFEIIASLLSPIYAHNDIYSEVTAISSVIFGYVLVTSVKKSKTRE